MNRKDFIKKGLIGLVAGVGVTLVGRAAQGTKAQERSQSVHVQRDKAASYVEITEAKFEALLKEGKPIRGIKVDITKPHLIPNGLSITECYFIKHPSGGWVWEQEPKDVVFCHNTIYCLAGEHLTPFFPVFAILG